MSNPAPLCTHIKIDGNRCGSPAVRETSECFHHSAVKTALGKVKPLEKVAYGSFNPIPFVFPEDRAAMQINYFLLLQALNEQRVEKRTADLMLRILSRKRNRPPSRSDEPFRGDQSSRSDRTRRRRRDILDAKTLFEAGMREKRGNFSFLSARSAVALLRRVTEFGRWMSLLQRGLCSGTRTHIR